jgi:hypothetical protein
MAIFYKMGYRSSKWRRRKKSEEGGKNDARVLLLFWLLQYPLQSSLYLQRKAVYAHYQDASGGGLARQYLRNEYLPRPFACLVLRHPGGEQTPIGFLTCLNLSRCELFALTGLPRVFYSKCTTKSISHGCLAWTAVRAASHVCFVVIRGNWRLRQLREASSLWLKHYLQAGWPPVRDPMRWMNFLNVSNSSGRTRPWDLLSL